MDSPITLELVYIKTWTGFLLELVFFRLGPGVPARISIRLPAGGGSSSRISLLLPPSQQLRAAGAPPDEAASSFLRIEQPRAAGAPPKAASSLSLYPVSIRGYTYSYCTLFVTSGKYETYKETIKGKGYTYSYLYSYYCYIE